MSARSRYPAGRSGGTTRSRGSWILAAVLLAAGCGALAAGGSAADRGILAAVQRFMLAYSGVFALVTLTAAVAAGLVATDRIIMSPGGRVVSQGVHRALSLAAAGFLASHVLLEVLAHRSRPVDAVAPFLASGRTLYLGLGTLASDLVLLIMATGVARHRFAAGRAATWRAIHVTAYLAWPLAVAHGLLAGRQARPYVDWSYGGCLAAVLLALLIRLVATSRGRAQVARQPVVRRPAAGPGRVPRQASVPYSDLYDSSAARLAVWPPVPPRPPLPRAIPPPRGQPGGGAQRGGVRRGSVQRGSIERGGVEGAAEPW